VHRYPISKIENLPCISSARLGIFHANVTDFDRKCIIWTKRYCHDSLFYNHSCQVQLVSGQHEGYRQSYDIVTVSKRRLSLSGTKGDLCSTGTMLESGEALPLIRRISSTRALLIFFLSLTSRSQSIRDLK
jgi:hypothetical protein